MLEVQNLAFGYTQPLGTVGHYRALNPGLTALVGRNGCGKSTLLRTLAGLQLPLSGQVALMGSPLAEQSARDRARQLSLVLTDRINVGGLLVQDVVALGRHPHPTSKNDQVLVDAALESLEVQHLAAQPMDALSDGERQKVAIARAFCQDTPVMLLDEPTAFLDFKARKELMAVLSEQAKTKRILFSTHDLHLLAGIELDVIWVDDEQVHIVDSDRAPGVLARLASS